MHAHHHFYPYNNSVDSRSSNSRSGALDPFYNIFFSPSRVNAALFDNLGLQFRIVRHDCYSWYISKKPALDTASTSIKQTHVWPCRAVRYRENDTRGRLIEYIAPTRGHIATRYSHLDKRRRDKMFRKRDASDAVRKTARVNMFKRGGQITDYNGTVIARSSNR